MNQEAMIEELPVSAGELLVLKRKKLELLQKRAELRKELGLGFYKPSPKQALFHAAGDKKRRMVRAGNRFGKSLMGCAEDCAWLQHERPWLSKNDPIRLLGIPQHPVKLLVITTDWDKVDEIFTSERGQSGKIWKYLPKGYVKSKRRNHSGAIDTIECIDGSLLRFDTVKSWQSNPQGAESSDWDAIHVDEPCPQDMWTAASRGLIDRNGSAWFTLTPLKEFWINDMFFPRANRVGGEVILATNRWAIMASIYDNPYLSREAIAEFERDLTEGEKECRLYGIPLELSGLIYPQFRPETHILQKLPLGWTDWNNPPQDYTTYFYIDPHPQTPHAVLFCAVSPFGQIFLFDEIFEHCSVETLSARIKGVLNDRFVTCAKIDPLAYINDPITETNMAEEFCRHGIFVEKATKALQQGILRVQSELAKPNRIFVSPHLREFIWEIGRYCWAKDNKPIDKDDHMMENFYRMLLDDPQYIKVEQANGIPISDIEINRSELELEDVDFAV